MPCKHILTDYRWAMEIQPYLEGIVLESEAQATTQMLSYPVILRTTRVTFRFLGGWNSKKFEISL